MSTKTKTKTDPKAANAALVERVIEVAGKHEVDELALLAEFADAVEAGRLIPDGVKATLKAAADRGAHLAYLKPSHAEYLVTMRNLAALDGAPASFAALYTLADRLTRTMPKAKGTSKAAAARAMSAKIADGSEGFEAVEKRTTREWKKAEAKKKPRSARPSKVTVTTPEAGSVNVADRIADLTAWIMTAEYDALTAEIQLALTVLADSIHDKLDELAE